MPCLYCVAMHIEQLKSGAWRAAVHHGGVRRNTKQFRTRAEASYAGAELITEMGGRPPETVTVEVLLAGFMADAGKTWSPNTHMRAMYSTGLLPESFTGRAVCDVTPAILDLLYKQLEREGWSLHTMRGAHMTLSVAWGKAIIYGWAKTNPFRDVKPPKPPPRQVVAPDHEQVAALLAATSGLERLYLQVALTAARRGEVVALGWADVDLGEHPVAQATLHITHSSVQAYGKVTDHGTKTGDKGHRVLALDRPTAVALRRWRTAQAALALAHGLPSPVHIFSDDAGVTPWTPDRASRMFKRACKRAGVTGVRLHDLRHYVATTMLEDGEPLLDVAAQLGHSSMTTTATVYAHYRKGHGAAAADRRAARLYGAG